MGATRTRERPRQKHRAHGALLRNAGMQGAAGRTQENGGDQVSAVFV